MSIGRKYTRSDAIGVGLTITVDFDTIEEDETKGTFDTVTLRYSSNGKQDRIHISKIIDSVNSLIKLNKIK